MASLINGFTILGGQLVAKRGGMQITIFRPI